ncbi:hypothetical protein D9758_016829 [Tetrapyrgos nigripes]|uniref:Uncharacterized protein n=1 Tax=Tetrapyrgos nigripes TaxID=182062 RepID=A0A8H5FIE6_9AGAR|nr:hypothetical protein D9758_016829 [Tetrapyrgos nigripes]
MVLLRSYRMTTISWAEILAAPRGPLDPDPDPEADYMVDISSPAVACIHDIGYSQSIIITITDPFDPFIAFFPSRASVVLVH